MSISISRPRGAYLPTKVQDLVAILIFLPVALLANTLAGQARLRTAEAEQRRREAEASRDELGVLAEQQAALRRVATLVARGVSPAEVFTAVADELARCLHVVNVGAAPIRAGRHRVVAAVHSEPGMTKMPVIGERIRWRATTWERGCYTPAAPPGLTATKTRPAQKPHVIRAEGIHSVVGVPLVVDGRLWGAAIVGSRRPEPMPPDTEARIADFADLVATAIANAANRADLKASRDELAVLAEQQASLRRVATLVARGVSPSDIFSVVADEMARCVHVAASAVHRYEADGTATLVAIHAPPQTERKPVVGERHSLEGDNLEARVLHTGRVARIDNHDSAAGPTAARLREMGVRSAVGVPIVVGARLWGMAAVASGTAEPLPADTEARVCDFADLVATAIANAATRAELVASRARIVAAGDEARRRLERDLHDGAQQRLVSLGLQLRLTEKSIPPQRNDLKEQLSQIVSGLTGVEEDLQEFSRGIHPMLSRGLDSAIGTLALRSAVPVTVDVAIDQRLPESAEVAAYYVVSEALTNAAKHAQASEVNVSARAENGNLDLVIHDDGVGGADSHKGSGLIGLMDRVEAVGGRLEITSQVGSGTSLHVEIPLANA